MYCFYQARKHNTPNTVFIQTVAVATINVSLAGVRLLIGAAFINFGAILLGVINTTD